MLSCLSALLIYATHNLHLKRQPSTKSHRLENAVSFMFDVLTHQTGASQYFIIDYFISSKVVLEQWMIKTDTYTLLTLFSIHLVTHAVELLARISKACTQAFHLRWLPHLASLILRPPCIYHTAALKSLKG